MSVTFSIRGIKVDYENPEPGTYINLANSNAREVLEHLGQFGDELYGELRGTELVRLCEVALKSNIFDGGTDDLEEATVGYATVIQCGRRPGYLTEKFNLLREMGVRAGDLGVVTWG